MSYSQDNPFEVWTVERGWVLPDKNFVEYWIRDNRALMRREKFWYGEIYTIICACFLYDARRYMSSEPEFGTYPDAEPPLKIEYYI